MSRFLIAGQSISGFACMLCKQTRVRDQQTSLQLTRANQPRQTDGSLGSSLLQLAQHPPRQSGQSLIGRSDQAVRSLASRGELTSARLSCQHRTLRRKKTTYYKTSLMLIVISIVLVTRIENVNVNIEKEFVLYRACRQPWGNSMHIRYSCLPACGSFCFFKSITACNLRSWRGIHSTYLIANKIEEAGFMIIQFPVFQCKNILKLNNCLFSFSSRALTFETLPAHPAQPIQRSPNCNSAWYTKASIIARSGRYGKACNCVYADSQLQGFVLHSPWRSRCKLYIEVHLLTMLPSCPNTTLWLAINTRLSLPAGFHGSVCLCSVCGKIRMPAILGVQYEQ